MDTLTDYNNARIDYNTDIDNFAYIFWNRPYEGTNEELYVDAELEDEKAGYGHQIDEEQIWFSEARMIREGEEALEYNNSLKY